MLGYFGNTLASLDHEASDTCVGSSCVFTPTCMEYLTTRRCERLSANINLLSDMWDSVLWGSVLGCGLKHPQQPLHCWKRDIVDL